MFDLTSLGGALRRVGLDQWIWVDDGSAEPRVRDSHLRDHAPNWRCTTPARGDCYIEVPWDWHPIVKDPDVRGVIARLVAEYPAPRLIYAEGLAETLGGHRIIKQGYLVPVLAWDLEMARVVGATWDREHEADILARARQMTGGG